MERVAGSLVAGPDGPTPYRDMLVTPFFRPNGRLFLICFLRETAGSSVPMVLFGDGTIWRVAGASLNGFFRRMVTLSVRDGHGSEMVLEFSLSSAACGGKANAKEFLKHAIRITSDAGPNEASSHGIPGRA